MSELVLESELGTSWMSSKAGLLPFFAASEGSALQALPDWTTRTRFSCATPLLFRVGVIR